MPQKLTRLQKEVLFGVLLGDGNLQWNENKTTARLRLGQSNYAYCMHLYEIFKPFVATPPKQNKEGVWYFNTLQYPMFRFYAQQFYGKNGIKRVPRLIHRWLTPRAVAYWFMDDGSAKDRNTSTGVRFCTDGFTHQDTKRLAKALSRVYNINTTTSRQRTSLRVYVSGRGTNAFRLRDQILPYIIPEMIYKVPPRWFN